MQPSSQSPMSLPDLVGRRMNSVEFIEDYIGLHFDGLCLHALSDPVIIQGSQTIHRADSGYCDALCSHIGETVERVEDLPTRLSVWLPKAQIVVPLDADWPPGPEMATLSGFGRFFNAWTKTGV